MSFIHMLWRKLPRSFRREVFMTISMALAPKASELSHLKPGGLTLAGLFSASTGLGEGARRLLKGFQANGLDVETYDLAPAFKQSDQHWREIPCVQTSGPLLVHINGPQIPYALARMPKKITRNRYIIGYWNWELPVLPDNWLSSLKYLHEIWVSSEFVAEVIRTRFNIPVYVVPYPIEGPTYTEQKRSAYAIDEDVFLFFTAFNMGSGFSRKNPIAVIDAFKAAFQQGENVHLFVKVSNSHLSSSHFSELISAVEGITNITIIDEIISHEDVMGLIQMSDAVISLHRSEGLGFLMVESILLKKATIGTGWSGNLDFMNHQNNWLVPYDLVQCVDSQGTYNVDGAKWAEPNISKASDFLQEVYQKSYDPDRLKHSYDEVSSYFSFENFQRNLPESLKRWLIDV